MEIEKRGEIILSGSLSRLNPSYKLLFKWNSELLDTPQYAEITSHSGIVSRSSSHNAIVTVLIKSNQEN